MATGGDPPDDIEDNPFDCPVCMVPFHNARMLPCGHSLCSSPRVCLSKTLEMSKPCPICRGDLDSRGAETEEDFPINYNLKAAQECFRSKEAAAKENKESLCDRHNKPNSLCCKDCSTILCETCWDQHHSSHVVVPFNRYKKEIQGNLSMSNVRMATSETKLDEIQERFNRMTSQCFSEGELLHELKNLFEKKKKCMEEVLFSKSFSEVSGKVTAFNLTGEKINELKEQFVREGHVVMKEFGDVLSEMEASLDSGSGTAESNEPRASKTDSSTRKFTVEVSSPYFFDDFDDCFSTWGTICAVDSELNMYVAKRIDWKIWKCKITTSPRLSLKLETSQSLHNRIWDIAVADNQLYVGWSTRNGEELCKLNKDTFEVIKTLNKPASLPKGTKEAFLSIKGNGTALMLWVGQIDYNFRVSTSQLYLYEKDKLVKSIPIEMSGESDSRGCCWMRTTDQCLILEWMKIEYGIKKISKISFAVIKWDQLQSKNKLPLLRSENEPIYYSFETSEDDYPLTFFNLGTEVHAIGKTFNVETNEQENICKFRIFSNALQTNSVTGKILSQQHTVYAFFPKDSPINDYGRSFIRDKVIDNVLLCIFKSDGRPCLSLLEIKNGSS